MNFPGIYPNIWSTFVFRQFCFFTSENEFSLPTCLGNSQRSNITPSFYYLQSEMYFVTATGGWIQGIQILQSSVSSPSFTPVLKPGPRCADDQMDLWCNLCKPFAPCKLENQRQDFRMALEQRLSSLWYLITNVHGLFSFTSSTFCPVFSDRDHLQNALVVFVSFFKSILFYYIAIVITPEHDKTFLGETQTFIITNMLTINENYVFWIVTRIGCCKQSQVKLLTVCSPIFPIQWFVEETHGWQNYTFIE